MTTFLPSPPLYCYRAQVVGVYDGGTITVDIDLGLGVWLKDVKLRLLGINTPEMRGNDRGRGVIARDWLRRQIQGQAVTIQTQKDDREKYGRLLAIVWLGERNLNNELLDLKLADPLVV